MMRAPFERIKVIFKIFFFKCSNISHPEKKPSELENPQSWKKSYVPSVSIFEDFDCTRIIKFVSLIFGGFFFVKLNLIFLYKVDKYNFYKAHIIILYSNLNFHKFSQDTINNLMLLRKT